MDRSSSRPRPRPPAASSIPRPALYVVATPIGNLADITLRALHVLALVDAIACEDTRHSAALLRHFAIAKPLIAVHEHNERAAAGAVLARLGRGERVAYVSDAGTPAVSDPGAGLVAAARAAGYRVVPIPGREQRARGAGGCGRHGAGWLFVRRLSGARGSRSERAPSSACARAAPTPDRVRGAAPDRGPRRRLAAACPDRPATLCRELTKQFETIATMPARALPAWLGADPNRARGEFVVVLHALPAIDPQADDANDAVLAPLLARCR